MWNLAPALAERVSRCPSARSRECNPRSSAHRWDGSASLGREICGRLWTVRIVRKHSVIKALGAAAGKSSYRLGLEQHCPLPIAGVEKPAATGCRTSSAVRTRRWPSPSNLDRNNCRGGAMSACGRSGRLRLTKKLTAINVPPHLGD